MRRAGRLVELLLSELKEVVRPGIKTKELDRFIARRVKELGVNASFKGYRGFPAHLCVSVNDEVVHGIPGERVLREGDIISLDLGIMADGYHADGGITVGVGRISPLAQRLIEVTRKALMAGVAQCRKGKHIGDISFAIQDQVESQGFSVVREYAGHGIGRELHEEPSVPNFGVPGEGIKLRPGMVLALEPMVNAGWWKTRCSPDGWTVLTADGSLSAYFEHTVAITDGEPEILTLP